MKKLLIFSIILALFLTGCGPVNVDVETDTRYVLDHVKVTYEDGNTSKLQYNFADPDRIAPASGTYYENDEKIGEEIYQVDENGSIISIEQTWSGGTTTTFEYSYDSEKRVIEKNEYRDNVLQTKTQIVYGDNGKEEKVTVFDEAENILTYQEFEYDGQSYRTVKEYDADGKLLRYLKHTYSYADVVAMEKEFSTKDELLSTTIWHYAPCTQTEYYIDIDTEYIERLK